MSDDAIIDDDDRRDFAKGVILFALALAAVLALAATVGLAWAVFQWAGGL